MSNLAPLHYVSTDPATQFVAVIAQNAGQYLGLNAAVLGTISGRGRIQHVSLRTVEQKAWELYFFGSAANNSATIALNKYLGRAAFAAADGLQIGGAGLYLFDKTCDIPIRDEGNSGLIHLVLVNRSTATAGGANQIAIELGIDLTSGA